MKKSLFFIVLAFIIGIFIILIPEEKQNFKVEFVDCLDENLENTKVCLKNKLGYLEVIDFQHKKVDNIYRYVLSLYNERRNSLPLDYSVPVSTIFEIENINKEGEKITIHLNKVTGNVKELLTSLMWTYQHLGIKQLKAYIDDKEYNLIENPDINVIYDSYVIGTDTRQIIYYFEQNSVLPVTYYHKEDSVEFILDKIFYKYSLKGITYSYTYNDNELSIYIEDKEYILNERFLQIIYFNILENFQNAEIRIFKNNVEL